MNESKPYLIGNINGDGETLERISPKDGVFKEDWLQNLLDNHPSILPLNIFNESFSNSISIGREIARIDNLFVNDKGYLTIVETKLWQNPEAHRTVVAQILDYARTLSTWKFKELDAKVAAYSQKNYGYFHGMHDLVKMNNPDFDLHPVNFEAIVQENLTNGNFLLLIVGDEIHPEATQLAEVIQSAPHLQFQLGFVELQCFRLNANEDWPLVVFPRPVLKSKEVTRAVVKVIYEESKPTVEVTTPSEKEVPSGKTNYDMFTASLPSQIKDSFILHLESWTDSDMEVYWGTVGFSLRVYWKTKRETIFDAYPTYASIFQDKRVEKMALPKEAHQQYKERLMQSPTISQKFIEGKRYIKYDEMSDEDVILLLQCSNDFARTIQSVESKPITP